jgi:hypothetical protein
MGGTAFAGKAIPGVARVGPYPKPFLFPCSFLAVR